jgi:ParB/RepB/Spo0J family partition protein
MVNVYLLPIQDILIDRDQRVRKEFTIDDLLDSIPRIGLLQPIVVTNEDGKFKLVAGERRLTACTKLGYETIACNFLEELSPTKQRIIELEENLKRVDFTWADRTAAVYSLHSLLSQERLEDADEEQTIADTARHLGISRTAVSDAIITQTAMKEGNARVAAAPTQTAALNILRRANDREIANVQLKLMSDIEDVVAPGTEVTTPPPGLLPAHFSIQNTSFEDFASSYKGLPFNFIHCDFPYGTNLHKSKQGDAAGAANTYSDTPADYRNCISTLIKYQDKLIADSATIMFWFDMAQYTETFKLLEELDFNIYPIPLIWHKSDNAGIISDVGRRARHIYETCLYGHRGDMKTVQVISDLYSAPTAKEEHQSTKPEPMLRNFFRAFVDNTSRVLDPTCGSGTALRAAESLNAEHVLGVELNGDNYDSAVTQLSIFRSKAAAAKLMAVKALTKEPTQ